MGIEQIMDAIIGASIIIIIVGALSLLLRGAKINPFVVLIIFVAVLGRDIFLVLGANYSWVVPMSVNWNWFGKLASLIFLASIAVLLLRDRFVTTIAYNGPVGRAPIATLALLAVTFVYATFVALTNAPSSWNGDLERIAFQASMPSLEEEFFFRGLMPVLMLASLGKLEAPNRLEYLLAIAIPSVLFAVLHVSGFNEWSFQFNLALLPHFLIISFLYAALRYYSGSILVPILAHSFSNLIIQFI